MSVISNLVVQLKGNTGNLDSALDKSGKKVAAFGNSGNKASKSLSSALSGLGGPVGKASSGLSALGGEASGLVGSLGLAGGAAIAFIAVIAAAAAGLVAFGVSSMNSIEATSRMAEELGVGYNALVGLQHAATMTGGSAEGMSVALRHLSTNLSAAAHGSADVNRNLATIGLTIDQLQGLTVDQQFLKLADALQKVNNGQDRVRIATELLGREGAHMIGSLKGGSAALEEFRRDADALGLTLDKEGIEKVQKGNAAWNRMEAAVQGVGNTMAVVLAPAIEWIGQSLVKLIGGITGANDSWDGFFKVLFRTTTAFTTIWNNFGLTAQLVWDQTIYGLSRFVTSVVFAFTDTIPALFSAFGEFAGTFFSNLWENIKNGWDALWDDKDFQWKGLADGWDAAMKKLQGKMVAPQTAFEKELADKIDKEKAELGKAWDAEFEKKWAEWKKKVTKDDGFKAGEGGKKTDAIDKGVASAEQGSQEAFKILAGSQGDKMYALQNNQLKELRDHNKKLDKLLREWANAQPVAAARLRR